MSEVILTNGVRRNYLTMVSCVSWNYVLIRLDKFLFVLSYNPLECGKNKNWNHGLTNPIRSGVIQTT